MSLIAPTGWAPPPPEYPQDWKCDDWIGLAEARRAILLLMDPDGWHEICSLPSTARSWFKVKDVEEILKCASWKDANENEKGVYLTLNPADESPFDWGGWHRASDRHISRRNWLFIESDAHGPDESCATDDEKLEAEDHIYRVHSWLTIDMGWPEPIIFDSGNGFYLLFRLEGVPADDLARAVVVRATAAIAANYGDAVDSRVTNAARLARLPGTMNRRGEHTTERPHRRARIISVPDGGLSSLPWGKLLEMAGPEKKAKKAKATGLMAPTGVGGGVGWAKSGLAQNVAELRASPVGSRNDKLFKAAVATYEIVHGGGITESEATEELWSAVRAIGLDSENEIRKTRRTLSGAFEKAKANPRAAPPRIADMACIVPLTETPPPDGDIDDSDAPDDDDSLFYPASDVQPRKVDWLWKDRVPLGKLTTFAGMGGLGKTFVLLDMVAKITTGSDWPDGDKGSEPGKVLFISGEDDPDDTLVPRLIELGADLSKVFFMTDSGLTKFTLANWPLLTKGMERAGDGVRLIVIDPPTAFLGGVDDHKNAELRRVLMPLKTFASHFKTAIIFNTHVNKGGAGKVEAMARVMGSVAWVNTVRAAHLFAKDADDQEKRVFLPLKSNLGRQMKGMAYKIAVTDQLAKVEWLGEVDTTADQAAIGSGRMRRDTKAALWLIKKFRKSLSWTSTILFDDASEDGISRNAIFEACALLKPPPTRNKHMLGDGDTEWTWSVPADWPGFSAKLEQPAKTAKSDGDAQSF